ncbi:MAG TPA: hypothetical protein VJ600_01170 [Holophagaceae bacterium]|nr:hypothetical protein [Holophagaceae bacterium]
MTLLRTSALALLPAALIAQAPAPASSLADTYRTAKPGIEAQMKEDPDKALAAALALIPADRPAFDNTNPPATGKSINEYRALTSLYRLASDAAYQAGQVEKSRELMVKAQDNAKATYQQAQAPLTKLVDLWKGAVDQAQKAMDEEKTLTAKSPRTPEEEQRLTYLTTNHATFENNLKVGNSQITYQTKSLQDLKDEPGDFDKALEVIDARLKAEAADLDKFQGNKVKYVAAGLKSIGKGMDQEKALMALRRFRVLDPANKAVGHRIDVLLGKAADKPARPVHRKKKG